MTGGFTVAGLTALPGQRAAQVLELSLAGVQTRLPLFILHGAAPGPTVLVTAGVHGAEYVGIETAYRLALQTSPDTLRGKLIVVPITSMTAFVKRAIYLAPPDDKNLNRMFPGDPDGSFAPQLAHWLFQNLIRHADFFIDLHGGDLNEALVPFSIFRQTGNAPVDDASLALARAFGLPNIVTSVVGGAAYAAAAEAGIPAIIAEVGGQGLWPEDDIQSMSAGLRRALAHLGLLDASDPAPSMEPRVVTEMHWMRSAHDGLFYPAVAVADEVQAGQTLGRLADYLGQTLETVVAPKGGVVLFLVTTLAMNAGDPLLAIGV